MQNWERKKLSDIVTQINGLWKGKKEPFINVAVIRNTNFSKDCQLKLDDVEYLDVEVKQFESRKLKYGDIIIEKSGGSEKQPVGRPILFDITEGNYSFSNFTSTLRIKETSDVSSEYLQQYLYYRWLEGDTRNLQSHTTGIHNLDFKKYLDFEIPLPPLEEQKRIVKILDEKFAQLETVKANAKTNFQNAKDLFQSQLTKAFSNSTWEKKRLGDCGTFKNGMNFASTDTGYTIRSLGVGDFKNLYQIDDTEQLSEISLKAAPSEDYLLKDEDIVFVRSNGNKELVGRCLLVYPKNIPTTYSGFCIRFRKDHDELDADFLLHYMKAESSRKILNGKEGANISNLNQKILGDFEVPVPPLSEQKRIVEQLDSLSEKVRSLEEIYTKQLANCDELKQAFLAKAFNGEL